MLRLTIEQLKINYTLEEVRHTRYLVTPEGQTMRWKTKYTPGDKITTPEDEVCYARLKINYGMV